MYVSIYFFSNGFQQIYVFVHKSSTLVYDICYRPFKGGGTGVILILYGFVVFTRRCFVLSLNI